MFFYELHEGDDDLFHDILLAREEEIDPDDFYELVQSIRRRVQDTFEDDTLIEAIAAELEREHEFLPLTDERIAAAVNVSRNDDDNFLVSSDDEARGADYRAVLADFDPDTGYQN